MFNLTGGSNGCTSTVDWVIVALKDLRLAITLLKKLQLLYMERMLEYLNLKITLKFF